MYSLERCLKLNCIQPQKKDIMYFLETDSTKHELIQFLDYNVYHIDTRKENQLAFIHAIKILGHAHYYPVLPYLTEIFENQDELLDEEDNDWDDESNIDKELSEISYPDEVVDAAREALRLLGDQKKYTQIFEILHDATLDTDVSLEYLSGAIYSHYLSNESIQQNFYSPTLREKVSLTSSLKDKLLKNFFEFPIFSCHHMAFSLDKDFLPFLEEVIENRALDTKDYISDEDLEIEWTQVVVTWFLFSLMKDKKEEKALEVFKELSIPYPDTNFQETYFSNSKKTNQEQQKYIYPQTSWHQELSQKLKERFGNNFLLEETKNFKKDGKILPFGN